MSEIELVRCTRGHTVKRGSCTAIVGQLVCPICECRIPGHSVDTFEGEGPPSIEELWSVAQYESESAASWIHDMPCTEQEIQTAKGDVLKALVALEMAEDRLNEVSD